MALTSSSPKDFIQFMVTVVGVKYMIQRFQDPAYFIATSQLQLIKDDPPVLWFMIWSLLMRFNRTFNASLLPLWRASDKTSFDKIMEKASMSSITTRGNESSSMVQGRVWDLRQFFKEAAGQELASTASHQLTDGVPFQEIIESMALPEDLRPYGFKHASKNFKLSFIGKVLAAVSPSFTHKEVIGGSLIAVSRADAEGSFQLYDLLSEYVERPELWRPDAEGRIAWGTWAYYHFNMGRQKLGLHEIGDGKVEHSGCEFVRYCRECLDRGHPEFIPPATLARIRAFEEVRSQREQQP